MYSFSSCVTSGRPSDISSSNEGEFKTGTEFVDTPFAFLKAFVTAFSFATVLFAGVSELPVVALTATAFFIGTDLRVVFFVANVFV